MSYIRWGLATILTSATISTLLYFVRNEFSTPCVKQLSVWMFGLVFCLVVHLLKKIVMVCFWSRGKNPMEQEAHTNLLYVLMFSFPESLWYMYGNAFIYTSSMEECMNNNNFEIKLLFYLTIGLIWSTYFFFLAILSIAVLFCLAFNKYKANAHSNENMTVNQYIDILAKVPVVNNFDTFALHRFSPKQIETPETKIR